MTFLRFLYFKSGEILTFAAAAAFVLYLLNAFSGSAAILADEKRAMERINDISLAEKDLMSRGRDPAGFEDLSGKRPSLEALEPVPLKGYPGLDLASDGRYYYLLRLSPRRGEETLYPAEGETVPGGFQVLCWPVRFAVTGEKCLYADGTGSMAVSPNVHGSLNGLKAFPPDFKPALEAAPKGKPRKGNEWIQTDGPGG